jgi:hypothetical protein
MQVLRRLMHVQHYPIVGRRGEPEPIRFHNFVVACASKPTRYVSALEAVALPDERAERVADLGGVTLEGSGEITSEDAGVTGPRLRLLGRRRWRDLGGRLVDHGLWKRFRHRRERHIRAQRQR